MYNEDREDFVLFVYIFEALASSDLVEKRFNYMENLYMKSDKYKMHHDNFRVKDGLEKCKSCCTTTNKSDIASSFASITDEKQTFRILRYCGSSAS